MSELSDKKSAPTVTEPLGGAAALGAAGSVARSSPSRSGRPSAARSWCSSCTCGSGGSPGPTSTRVPGGPTDPPMYMKAFLTFNAILMCVGLPIAIWWFIVRPWRRERRITLDGMLMVSMGLMFFQDPLLNYFNTWCTYNTWLWNRGSWSSDIPGWVSPEAPGHQVAEPLLINAPGYTAGVLIITIFGCWVMRKIKARWPNISNLRLILVTYAFTFVLDFVMEAGFMLPFGLYTYPGAIRSVSVVRRHVSPVAHLRRADVGRRPGGAVLPALLHRRSRPHHRRTRTRPGPGRRRQAAVHPLPGDLRRGQRMLLLLLQRARAVDRHALRPLARGPPEALLLQRRHLRRRDRRALPRSRSADTHQALRLTSTPTASSCFRRASSFRQTVPFERGN